MKAIAGVLIGVAVSVGLFAVAPTDDVSNDGRLVYVVISGACAQIAYHIHTYRRQP